MCEIQYSVSVFETDLIEMDLREGKVALDRGQGRYRPVPATGEKAA